MPTASRDDLGNDKGNSAAPRLRSFEKFGALFCTRPCGTGQRSPPYKNSAADLALHRGEVLNSITTARSQRIGGLVLPTLAPFFV